MGESLELWNINAVKVNVREPFTLTSGNRSPIYIDCRQIIGHPKLFKSIVKGLERFATSLNFDVVAGGVTAGVPFAAWLAWELDKPLAYIRPKKKEFGAKGKIEGKISDGDRVLLIEDLITDGGSKLGFIESIREKGAEIGDCLVVMDREQGGKDTLKVKEVKLHSLLTLSNVLDAGVGDGRISKEDMEEIREYIVSPEEWHKKRGFDFSNQ